MESFTYCLPAGFSLKKLKKIVRSHSSYKIEFEKGELCRSVLLDTFDNELLQSGRLLLQTEELLVLMNMATGQFTEQNSVKKWSFVAGLDVGPVTLLLADVSPLRALVPIFSLDMRKGQGNLLDDEGKTRVRFVNLSLYRDEMSVAIGVTSTLRGYNRANVNFKKWLLEFGAVSCQEVKEICAPLGIRSNQYNAKPRLQLEEQGSIKKNTTTIIDTFLRVARANEKGIIADFDTEFLHDFRVSLRKVRSVLSLFKGVYTLADTEWLKREFSQLMQETNTLRDLDVYLLNKKDYYAMVPVTTYDGLDILFKGFERERKAEHKKIVHLMKSKRYMQQMIKLQMLFKGGGNLKNGPRGDEITRDFACRIILKRYRTVCKIARSIDETTKDEVVHRLRIHCKKLRYLMEFFATLFPGSESKFLIKSLKRLQDNLGKFNDYSVQQIFLKEVLSGQSVNKTKGIAVAESIGALTAMLYQLQNKERMQVMKNFSRFDSREIRQTFDKLFSNGVIYNEDLSVLQ